ncbi:TetR/AcrR family transcriptional regulator [Edaphobacter aggregans]|uniref:TetR/AcrR family transcriptional regulator n=1 Tax=Edaphobacter aggregans TaxID=570835 RepID=UPI0007E8D668|nr:TetR/AcrR family transcriptional regulator [Edaphobacter aggregans]
MSQKGFEEISVHDITALADVNRATFYDHYTDKFALLDAMVAGGFHKLLAERNVMFDGTCPSAASAIILATCDYLTATHADPQDCNRNSAFEPLMEAGIVAAIRRTLLAGIENKAVPEGLTPEIVATTAAWAIYGAVKQWFYTPNHQPAAEAVQPIMNLVFPILATVSSGAPHSSGALHEPVEAELTAH